MVRCLLAIESEVGFGKMASEAVGRAEGLLIKLGDGGLCAEPDERNLSLLK